MRDQWSFSTVWRKSLPLHHWTHWPAAVHSLFMSSWCTDHLDHSRHFRPSNLCFLMKWWYREVFSSIMNVVSCVWLWLLGCLPTGESLWCSGVYHQTGQSRKSDHFWSPQAAWFEESFTSVAQRWCRMNYADLVLSFLAAYTNLVFVNVLNFILFLYFVFTLILKFL